MTDFDSLLNHYTLFLDAAIAERSRQTALFLAAEERKTTHPETVLGETLFAVGFRPSSRVSDVVDAIHSRRHTDEQAQAILSDLQDEWTDYQRTLYYHPDVFDRFFISHTGAATSFDNDSYAIRCFEKNVTLANICNNQMWSLASTRRHGLAIVAPLREANIGQRPLILSRLRSTIMACERDYLRKVEENAAENRKRGRSALDSSEENQRELLIEETHKKHDSQMKQSALDALKITQAFVLKELTDAHTAWETQELVFQQRIRVTLTAVRSAILDLSDKTAEIFNLARNECLHLATSPFATEDPVRQQKDYYLKLCNDSFNKYVQGIHDAVSGATPGALTEVLRHMFDAFQRDNTAHADLLNTHMDTQSVQFAREQSILLRSTYLFSCRAVISKAFREAHGYFRTTIDKVNDLLAADPLSDASHPNRDLLVVMDHLIATMVNQRTASLRDARSVESYAIESINKILMPVGLTCSRQDVAGGDPVYKIPGIHSRTYKTYFERLRLCVHADVAVMRNVMYTKIAHMARADAGQPRSLQHIQADVLREIETFMPHARLSDTFNTNEFNIMCPKGVLYLKDEVHVITGLDLTQTMVLADEADKFTAGDLLQSYIEYAQNQYRRHVGALMKRETIPRPVFETPGKAELETLYTEWFVDQASWTPFAEFCSTRLVILQQDLVPQLPLAATWVANAQQAVKHAGVGKQPLFKHVMDMVRNIAKAEMMLELVEQNALTH